MVSGILGTAAPGTQPGTDIASAVKGNESEKKDEGGNAGKLLEALQLILGTAQALSGQANQGGSPDSSNILGSITQLAEIAGGSSGGEASGITKGIGKAVEGFSSIF